MTIRAWTLFLVCSFFAPSSIAQTTGSISGTVVGEGSENFDQMRICRSVTNGNYTGISCYTTVDAGGHFELTGLKFGTYEIFAINEDEGYSIENQRPGEEVTLSSMNPAQNVDIRLRARGAILTGSARDKVTGKVVKDAWINYTMIDDGSSGGSRRISDDGRFSIAVPSETRLLVIVTARGYKGWVYNDASQPLVKLVSGERRVVDVELESLPKNSGPH